MSINQKFVNFFQDDTKENRNEIKFFIKRFI